MNQLYIIPRLQEDVAVLLADGQFHQPGAAAGPAHARTTGGGITRAVRGAQQVLAKGVEEFTFAPVKLQRPVRAAVEIGVHGATETDGKGGNRLAMTAPVKRIPRPRSTSSRLRQMTGRWPVATMHRPR